MLVARAKGPMIHVADVEAAVHPRRHGAPRVAKVTVLVPYGSPPQARNDAVVTYWHDGDPRRMSQGFDGLQLRKGRRRESPAVASRHFLT